MQLSFGMIDLIVIIFLVFSFLFGLLRGFNRKHLAQLAFSVGGGAAYLLGLPLAKMIQSSGFGSVTLQNLFKKLLTGDAMTVTLSATKSEADAQIAAGLSSLKIPSFFQSFFLTNVTDTSSDVATAIASAFSYFAIIIGSFVLVYVIVALVIFLVFKPLWRDDTLFGIDGKSIFGRIVGGFYSIVKGILTCLSAMLVLVLVSELMIRFMSNTSLSDWMTNDLNLTNASGFSIGRTFYSVAKCILGWISIGV